MIVNNNMTEIDLEEFTTFSTIKEWFGDAAFDRTSLYEFVDNVIMSKKGFNGNGRMLPDLSNLYVLLSVIDFPFEKLTSNVKHSDHTTSKRKISIDLSIAKKYGILGYIQISKQTYKNDDNVMIHFIESIDSRISGLNIARYMINKYENMYAQPGKVKLLPLNIVWDARHYWEMYFNEEYVLQDREDFMRLLTGFKLVNNYQFKNLRRMTSNKYTTSCFCVNWDALYSVFLEVYGEPEEIFDFYNFDDFD
jgi:hypothetical protein